jgi:hypothetical protein
MRDIMSYGMVSVTCLSDGFCVVCCNLKRTEW